MALALRPQWTEKLYRPSGGQDHLGLGSVSSDRILPKLVPGINVLTFHPRYWSFYAFLLDEFWRRDLPRTRRAFVEFYRPCEAIFAVGAQLCDQPEHEQYGRLRGVAHREHAGQGVPQAPPVARVGDRGETFQQARAFAQSKRPGSVELGSNGGDRRRRDRQA